MEEIHSYPIARFIRTVCMRRIRWSCEGLTSVHNEYTGYTFEAFIAETYVQLATTDANVLCAQALHSETSYWVDVLRSSADARILSCWMLSTLYCVVIYILLV